MGIMVGIMWILGHLPTGSGQASTQEAGAGRQAAKYPGGNPVKQQRSQFAKPRKVGCKLHGSQTAEAKKDTGTLAHTPTPTVLLCDERA